MKLWTIQTEALYQEILSTGVYRCDFQQTHMLGWKRAMMERNWERVFDLSPMKNEWTARGESIQATFWELRKEQIRKTWLFTSATPKPSCLETD